MKYPIALIFLLMVAVSPAGSQQQPEKKLRIVDTLTANEKTTRNPILLRSELDSIIAAQPVTIPQRTEPVTEDSETKFTLSTPAIIIGLILLAGIAFFLVLLLKRQKKIIKSSIAVRQDVRELAQKMNEDDAGPKSEKQVRQKAALEKKIEELTSEIERLTINNKAALEDYQAIKESIASVYKIRNYPGYEKKKGDGQLVKELIHTERSVAVYAFEKFLRPLISIADANKNNPARMSNEDSEKLFDLLISLSLFYIEYLYLRIDELSVGGHIVERIGSHAKGNGIDHELLKKLNTDHGSRALAIRIALDKKGIGKLSYPVFDETNLNNA
jgi:hypothetical protein